MPENDASPFLELALPSSDQPLRFEDPQQLEEWVQHQIALWNDVSGRGGTNIRNHIHGQIIHKLSNVQNLCRNARRHDRSSDQFAQYRSEAQRVMQEVYQRGDVPLADSPAGEFLKQLAASRGQNVAAGAAAVLMRIPFNVQPQSVDEVIGAALAVGFLEGARLEEPARRALEHMSARSQALLEQIEAERRAIGELRETTETEFAGQLESQETSFNELMAASRSKLEELERFFSEKLALQAPIRYWSNKAKQHRRAKCWQLAAGLVGAVLLGGISLLVVVSQPKFLHLDELHPPLGIAFLMVLVVVLAVWLIRLTFKLFLSNQHLEASAKEREVMVTTYLALRQEENFDDSTKRIILQAIFRPTVTGMVKEEGPVGILGLLTNALK